MSETLTTPDGRFGFTLSVGRLKTNPASVRWDSPSSRALRDAIASVTSQVPDPHTRHYAGDIRYPIRLSNAPAFGIGSLAGNFYGPNEWVDIDDLVNSVNDDHDSLNRFAPLERNRAKVGDRAPTAEEQLVTAC